MASRRIVRDWRGRFARTAGHRQSSNTKKLKKGSPERREAVAKAAKESRTRPAARPRGTAPAAPARTRPSTPNKRVSTEDYNMRYKPAGAKVVARAREVPDEKWDLLPITDISPDVELIANEETVKLSSIEKVTSGREPFRAGYIAQLWRDQGGDLHVVDGHTRAAMYRTLGKDMPARIMDEKKYQQLVGGTQRQKEGALIDSKLSDGKFTKDRAGFVNDVAALSTPKEMDKQDNSAYSDPELRQVIREASEEEFVRAVEAAPEIRASMRRVVAAMGGNMEREYDPETGAPTAVKQQHSIYRKLQKEMTADGVKDPRLVQLKDTVRFTATFGDEDYAAAVTALREEITKNGGKQVKPPLDLNDGNSGWLVGPYRGINFSFEDKDGLPFEVQIHTKDSLRVAEINHAFYNVTRKADDGDPPGSELQKMMDNGDAEKESGISAKGKTLQEYVNELNEIALNNAESVKVPTGVAILDKEGKRQWIIRRTGSSQYVSARTGKRIAKPKW